jgi:Zn-dependent M16 (insulinase) family peptidase
LKYQVLFAKMSNSATTAVDLGDFELLYSTKVNGVIPVHKYQSKKTALKIVIAEVDGPVVNGYFTLATEAHDDDGLPHTLEHLIFLGSDSYPYKGMLDILANRCLASGTNGTTKIVF